MGKWEVNWTDCFFVPQDLAEIQVEQPQKEDDYQESQSLKILMASGLRLTYTSKLDMHSVSLKVRGIQVWQPSMSDTNFRKSVMICQIIDSVDNHFGEYL